METIKNRYYFVTYDKELRDTLSLLKRIKESGWVDDSVTIVNCAPLYSGRICQVLNHKLSYLNENELFEQVDLEIPYPNMSQVWNVEEKEFQLFESYVDKWIKTHIRKDRKYLFVDLCICGDTRNLHKLKMIIKKVLEPDNYRFATLYLNSSSAFAPDYFVQEINFNEKEGILFEWENIDNPNWGY